MELFDFEISMSTMEISANQRRLKWCFWGWSINGSLIIALLITGYYCNSYDWTNGFGIGLNAICLLENIFGYRNSKSDIHIHKLRLDIYMLMKEKMDKFKTTLAHEQ